MRQVENKPVMCREIALLPVSLATQKFPLYESQYQMTSANQHTVHRLH